MNQKQRKSRKGSILAAVLALVFVLTAGIAPQSATAAGAQNFESMKKDLADHIFEDGKISEAIEKELASSPERGLPYAAFISVGSGSARAAVFSATGSSVRGAYDNAIVKAKKHIQSNNVSVEYLKADLVNFVQSVESDMLGTSISALRFGRFRSGLSFDKKFETAFLEAELNANQMIDYANGKININEVNAYLSAFGRASARLPQKLYLFSCRGYISDGGKCYTLGYKQDNSYGLRSRQTSTNLTAAKRVIDSNVKYLISTINSDGSFVYGRNADTGKIIPDYNIIRHAGTSWELVKDYAITKNPSLREPIDKVAEYLARSVVYKDKQTAFIWQKGTREVALGGNGLALLMFAEYEKAFQTGKYRELCEQLGNGILYMMDQETGEFRHIYYYGEAGKEDFTVKRIMPESFYNGEAAYALGVLYGLTKDEKWLDAATVAVDNFLREGRDKHKDHWTAYTMNEITKYKPEKEYYSFAMQNLKADLPIIQKKKTAGYTEMEKLMAYFELYERMKPSEKAALAADVSEDEFIQTIFNRADFMLNSYFYPEAAIYMKNPRQIMGAVYVREDQFRVRIDDVQHFLGGYHRFYRQHDRLLKYIAD